MFLYCCSCVLLYCHSLSVYTPASSCRCHRSSVDNIFFSCSLFTSDSLVYFVKWKEKRLIFPKLRYQRKNGTEISNNTQSYQNVNSTCIIGACSTAPRLFWLCHLRLFWLISYNILISTLIQPISSQAVTQLSVAILHIYWQHCDLMT